MPASDPPAGGGAPQEETPDSKLTRSKRRWAEEGRFLTGRRPDPSQTRSDRDRLPPGQHLVRDWPVLDLGNEPRFTLERWRLDVDGLVETPLSLDWRAFQALPQVRSTSDIHCVTSWSRYDNRWKGVATHELLDRAGPLAAATAVLLHGYDGYTTNLSLADFAAEGALLAHAWEGEPLTREHGGPVRLVVPHLYFWKSAKWLRLIELVAEERAGFWERNGYHLRGDPWAEERYSD